VDDVDVSDVPLLDGRFPLDDLPSFGLLTVSVIRRFPQGTAEPCDESLEIRRLAGPDRNSPEGDVAVECQH
jgi:hypothetical protein